MGVHDLWRVTNNIVGNTINLAEIFDIDENGIKIGDIINATHPVLGQGQFIALRGVASLAVGHAVAFNSYSGNVVRAITATHALKGVPIAISLAANTSSSKLSWYQILGNAIAQSASSVVVGNPVYLTTTAGVIDDAVVNGSQIANASVGSVVIASIGGEPLASNQFVLNIARATTQTGATA